MPLTTTTQTPTQSLRDALEETIGPELAGALEKKGFERLTPVQQAVLSPELQGKDLRISSQTGSGKTVAIGLALRGDVAAEEPQDDASRDEETSGNVKGRDQRARPRALVVTPTRELAKQVEEELAWLYAPLGARIASVTGGGGYRDELRAFRAKPAIIVGTPGRLLDHLKRGAIDGSATGAVVLDEADRMLDLGFREDLLAILGYAPPEHRTHLVSATFPREVKALADRVQGDWVPVEGTPLGSANLDIEHLIHLVHPRERLAAIINLLLETPGAQSLIFARTRADVADIAAALSDAGFVISMLSGEMEQAERNRALAAFKRGNVDALVATDVAARGIDVQDVARVLHAEPPTDADAYTHRSGRTGRAGKKGISSVLVAERELARTIGLLGRARVRWRFAPLPTAGEIRDARDRRLLEALTADFIEGEAIDPRSLALAEQVLASSEPARAVGRLVALALRRSQAEPRELTRINPPAQAPRGAGAARRQEYGRYDEGHGRDRRGDFGQDVGGEARGGEARGGDWVAFRVSWGESHGADPRRLVAMMCRRGQITGRDIGAIRVGRTSSVLEVTSRVAASFSAPRPSPIRAIHASTSGAGT
ncbi:MAG: DEAD/DEAH box helicase [Labilithrix sp.]|nr:DEAD/DEAH box helicase [Labilithrix sp.]